MSNKKTIILGLGSIAAIAGPIAAVVSCGTSLSHHSIGAEGETFASIKDSPYNFAVVDNIKGDLKPASGNDAEFIQEYGIKTMFDGSNGFSFDGSDTSFDGSQTFTENTSKFLRDGDIKNGKAVEIVAKSKGFGLIKDGKNYKIHDYKKTKTHSSDISISGVLGKVNSFDVSLDGTKYVISTDKGIFGTMTSTIKDAEKILMHGASFIYIKDHKLFFMFHLMFIVREI